MSLDLKWVPGRYVICRFEPGTSLPAWTHDYFSITRTSTEISVVIAEQHVPEDHLGEEGWSMLMIQGPLDFNLTGILSSLADPLAKAAISIFAMSTYDTDYLLVKDQQRAAIALQNAGFRFPDGLDP